MPILKTFAALIVLSISIVLGGCSKPSEEYAAIKAIPGEQWDAYAKRLPIGKRLDLHEEIMSRDGPNPTRTIIGSFSDNPQSIYAEIVRRIQSENDSRYLVPILYEINRNVGFDICEMNDRKIVQNYLSKNATEAVAPMDRPEFYRC
jgi:hypothetical protein